VNYSRRRTILSRAAIEAARAEGQHAAVIRWMPILVAGKAAANELLPGARARSELGIVAVGRYRKVVREAAPEKSTQRYGTFFSTTF
jgi:hypothetical protein